MNKINNKYKTLLIGKYHKGVDYCPFCDFKPKILHNYTLGFTNSNDGMMVVIECPACFEKWYFHARECDVFSQYETFLCSIQNNTNIHFINSSDN